MNINSLIFSMFKCVLLTIIIEIILGLIFGIKNKKGIITIIGVNILTNPIVVFIYSLITKSSVRIIVLTVMEIIVVLVEGLIYKRKLLNKKISPFLLSSILNLCSYLFGTFIIKYI